MKKLLLIGVCCAVLLCSCSKFIVIGNKCTGEYKDVEQYMRGQVKSKIEDLVLIDTIHIDEYSYKDSFGLDGAIFWEGKEKDVPAHNILYYRAYSVELESYIFLRWNDERNSMFYTMIENYNNDTEKESALSIVQGIEAFCTVQEIEYNKYEYTGNDINQAYILTKGYYDSVKSEYYDPFNMSQSQLYITLTLDINEDELRLRSNDVQTIVDGGEYGISLIIITNDNLQVVFYRGGEPMLNMSNGMSTYFN